MSAEGIKAMQRRFFAEFFGKEKLKVADEAFAPDHVYFNPDTPKGIGGPEGMKQFVVGTFRGAFPDLQGTVEDQVAEPSTYRQASEGSRDVYQPQRRGQVRGELASV